MSKKFTIGKPGGNGGSGGGFRKDDHEGHLLAFIGISYQESVSTVHGDTDAVVIETLVCLDDIQLWNDQMIFGAALVPRLAEAEGDIIGGRLVKGEAKAGRNAPWLLVEPDDDDMKHMDEFFDENATRLKSGRIIVELPPTDDDDPEKF
jgi:hypothetical protein